MADTPPLPEEVAQQLLKLQRVVAGLEAALQPFLSAAVRDLDAQLAPLPRAQAHLALAHAAGALLQLLLRARGVDPEHHAANKETKRLAQFAKKVAKAAADKELRESRRSLEVDVVAMSRFIAAALPDLSAAQRLSLKSAKSGQAAKRTAGGGAGGASGGVRRPQSGASHKDEAAAFLEETLAGGGGAPS